MKLSLSMQHNRKRRRKKPKGHYAGKKRSRAYTGVALTCEKCQEEPVTRRVVGVKDEGWRFVCQECWQDILDGAVWEPPTGEVMVHNCTENLVPFADAANLATRFIEQELAQHDLSGARAIYIALKTNKMQVGVFPSVKTAIPERPKGKGSRAKLKTWKPWYNISVAVRENLAFPATDTLPIRSVQIKDEMDRELMNRDWFWEYEEVTFHDPVESYVYGAGFGVFKVLRALRVVPGRATKAAQRRFGVEWLQAFRKWRKQVESSKAPFSVAS